MNSPAFRRGYCGLPPRLLRPQPGSRWRLKASRTAAGGHGKHFACRLSDIVIYPQ
jgi:hypothetical protein